MKVNVSPMFLTYYMVKWEDVKQQESNLKCVLCGKQLMQTELITDQKGTDYEGYVCHSDKQVTWSRVG